jgi:enamine deaminase RidA (YjgF/YER057c/UK114 family)
MAECTISIQRGDNINCSTVNAAGVRHFHAVAMPGRGTTFRQQAIESLCAIDGAIRTANAPATIVRQTVFLADAARLEECRQIAREHYRSSLPATDFVHQPPCDGRQLAMEIYGVYRDRGNVELEHADERLVSLRHNGIRWIHCAHALSPMPNGLVYDDTTDALDQIGSQLASLGLSFNQVVRTWFYLGGIVESEGASKRYERLNASRDDFYKDLSFNFGRLRNSTRKKTYPASTGIGTEGRGVTISALAIDADRKDVAVVFLENPRQTSAFDYSAVYSPKSPKFSRAAAVAFDDCATIFISGTASITNSETRHPGDVVAQTHETLDNIAALISEDNFARQGMCGHGASLDGLASARVYVKRASDYPKVRAVCRKRLGRVPIVYTKADVCRSDLEVEIEGIAYSCKAADRSRYVPAPHFPRVAAPTFGGETANAHLVIR